MNPIPSLERRTGEGSDVYADFSPEAYDAGFQLHAIQLAQRRLRRIPR